VADTFTESTSTSYGGRIKNSFKGVFVGILLIIGSVILLFWNEGRAIRTEKGLKEGSSAVQTISAESVNSANDGKLVHLSGPLSTSGPVKDDSFNIQAPDTISLERVVEMYQWKENRSTETKKKLGGGEEQITTYEYKQEWSPELLSSSGFKHPEGHSNPETMPYQKAQFNATEVKLQAFLVSPDLLAQLNDPESLPVTQANLSQLPDPIKAKAKLSDGNFYFGANPATPQVGDARVSFKVIKPSVVSIVSQQQGNSFHAYTTQQGTSIALISRGQKTAVEMFKSALAANRNFTWLLRGLGFLLLFAGFGMIFKPLSVLADVVPFIGSIVGAGTGLISFLLAVAFWLATVGIAWLYYRPVLGIAMLAGVVAALVLAVVKLKKNRPVAAPVSA